MKQSFTLILALTVLLSVSTATQGQRRRTPKRSTAATKAAKAAEAAAAEVKVGRERVATQIKTLSRFLYLYGGITKGIESVDKSLREASTVTVQQNEQNKAKVKESIRNVRDGLDRLESDFRFSPALKTYYPHLSGVATTAETAEAQAAANRFDEAGRSLLAVVNRLSDALAAMR